MAVPINSRQAISYLLRQSFNQSKLRTSATCSTTRLFSSQTTRSRDAIHHSNPAAAPNEAPNTEFVPFDTSSTTPSTQSTDASQPQSWPAARTTSMDSDTASRDTKPPDIIITRRSEQPTNYPKPSTNSSRHTSSPRKSSSTSPSIKAPTKPTTPTSTSTYRKQTPFPQSLQTSQFPGEPREPHEKPTWAVQKAALQRKLGPSTPWNPAKKLSPDALEGIRALNAQYPEHFTTPVLADYFKVSPEAIRRILKSQWKPSPVEEEDRAARWERRGERVWADLVRKKGMHPPKKWREKGIAQGIPRQASGGLNRKWMERNKEVLKARTPPQNLTGT